VELFLNDASDSPTIQSDYDAKVPARFISRAIPLSVSNA
jgi:hypothetical protein